MSSLGNRFLGKSTLLYSPCVLGMPYYPGIMNKNNLWARVLSSSAMLEPETLEGIPERINRVVSKLSQAASTREHLGSFAKRRAQGVSSYEVRLRTTGSPSSCSLLGIASSCNRLGGAGN